MLYQHPAARRDLVEHFVYLAEHASLDTADRFLTQAAASFEALAEQPLMGAPLVLKATALVGLRKWRVNGFDSHMIFYVPRPTGGIAVVRVLHASRDWWELLGIDTSTGKQ